MLLCKLFQEGKEFCSRLHLKLKIAHSFSCYLSHLKHFLLMCVCVCVPACLYVQGMRASPRGGQEERTEEYQGRFLTKPRPKLSMEITKTIALCLAFRTRGIMR